MNVAYIDNPTHRINPYGGFKTASDLSALELFKAGAKLHTWRIAVPANWWLETVDGKGVELPHRYGSEPWGGYSSDIVSHFLKIAKKQFDATERVARYGFLGDRLSGGPPIESVWVFDDIAADKLEKQWQEVQEGLRQRRMLTREPDLSSIKSLSADARAMLRAIRNKPVYPYPVLKSMLKELEAHALITLGEDLHFSLHPAVTKEHLPEGRTIRLKVVGPYQFPS